ncbi:MAG: gamma-glutamyltransferase, partial [Bryobacteraceae bacterium]
QAGAQVLARGGSAVDAAIAANAVLGVVEPMMSGIGGDLFALYWDAKTGQLTGINSSGPAPKALSIAYLKRQGYSSMPTSGIYTVTVPGCVRGWAAMHHRFGRLPWRDLFAPAIYYAEHGFPVTEIIQYDWEHAYSRLAADDNARRVYLPGGAAPKTGRIFRNPEMAHAYRLIAAEGPDAFYKGPISQAILATSKRLGGVMTAEDLAQFEPEWVQPISTTYRGWTVYELPPNAQGIGTLEMLNLLEPFPIGDYAQLSAEALHLEIEAQKLSFQDIRHYIGDPRFVKVPVAGLLSKEYARKRAAEIDMNKANCDTHPGHPGEAVGNTIYLSVIDRDGNIASWIESLSDSFGSGVVVDGMGFHLHNRGSGFSFDPADANSLAPGKRPYHTIIPGFLEKGSLHAGFGIMRGMNQAQAQAQFVSNVVDHGMNIQAALEAPRFTKMTLGGCDVEIEGRVPADVRAALEKKGHQISVVGDYSSDMGGGQAVMRDSATGVNYGASSPRKDGAAIPEPDPYFTTRR